MDDSESKKQERKKKIVLVVIISLLIFSFFEFVVNQKAKSRVATAESNLYHVVLRLGTLEARNNDINIVQARELSARAQLLFQTDISKQMTSVLLAIESMRLSPSAEAGQILMQNNLAYSVSYMEHLLMSNGVHIAGFSPDGRYIVSLGSHDDTVRVWETDSGEEVARMNHPYGAWTADISSDGKYVVSGGSDGYARVWEIDTGKEVSSIFHGVTIWRVTFSPNDQYIVSSSDDNGTTLIWEVKTGKEIARMTREYGAPFAVFSPDGKYVIDNAANMAGDFADLGFTRITYEKAFSAISPDGQYALSLECEKKESSGICSRSLILVWNIKTGEDVTRIPYEGAVSAVMFSPNGGYVLSGSNDKTIRIWDIKTGKELTRLVHGDGILAATYSLDGNYVMSSSQDGVIHIWDIHTGLEVANMIQFTRSIAFSFDQKYVASASGYGVRVWKIDNQIEIAHMDHGQQFSLVAVSPDGRFIASGGANNSAIDDMVRIWEADTGNEVSIVKSGENMTSIAFSPDGQYLATGSYDHSVRVWNVSTGEEIARMNHGDFVYSVAFSPDGKYVVSGSRDHTVRVWNTLTGEEVAQQAYPGEVKIAIFSPVGKYVASAGCEKSQSTGTCAQDLLRVWDVSTGEEISHMTHDSEVLSMDFSSDGKYIVSGGDTTARVWETETGKEIARTSYETLVSSVDFSPDGRYVVSVGGFVTRVWESNTGREILQMRNAASAAFSPDGKYVLATDMDNNTVRIWDIGTGEEIVQRKYDKEEYIHSVAFSSDGKYVVSSAGETIRVWLYRPEDLLADACSRVTRNLTREEWTQFIGDTLPYEAVCPNLPIE